MNWKDEIALGTQADEYHAVMQQAARFALTQLGGYIPKKGVFVDDASTFRGAFLEIVDAKPKEQEVSDDFGFPPDNYIDLEWTKSMCTPIEQACKFFSDFGWMAGSSVLWYYTIRADGVWHWDYGDIDVFCHSESSYNELKVFYSKRNHTETEHAFKLNDGFSIGINEHPYATEIYSKLNLIKPKPEDNWQYVQNVLAGFDLSVCAVAMVEPGKLYALYPDDVKDRTINYKGHTFPITTMRRIFKYASRGFKLADRFWQDVAANDQMLPFMALLESFLNVRQSVGEKATTRILLDIANAMPYDYEGRDSY